MRVTSIQNIKKYTVTANQATKQVRVVVNAPIQKVTRITIAQLGQRGFTGISAYDIAVNNGFIGTEAQWLLGFYPTTNEIPIGLFDGVNATFTSLNGFVPETLTVFLNGILQKIIFDYNTIGDSTIVLNHSPSVNENLTINYFKI